MGLRQSSARHNNEPRPPQPQPPRPQPPLLHQTPATDVVLCADRREAAIAAQDGSVVVCEWLQGASAPAAATAAAPWPTPLQGGRCAGCGGTSGG